jgi:gliding motility-associated-like protein
MRITLPELKPLKQFVLKVLILFFLICAGTNLRAQCPPNLDFELGDFTGWECWIGVPAINLGQNVINWAPNAPVPPVPGRHTMLSANPGDGIDQYGFFPKNCPNGSGHSIQLGNEVLTTPNPKAQGVSYTFTIPAGQNEFNLIYHYALVLHLPPHPVVEMPRFIVEIENLTDGGTLPCPMAPFIPANGLPGFFDSPINPEVKCKNWAAASIKLNGYAGKTFRIFFKTATCIPSGHFGYAYIDLNTECSSAFVGATYCPDDAFINVTAPYGYQNYTWWDATFTTVLGNTQTINFTPPPPPGTVIAVVADPFAGYGCRDTLYASLLDTLNITSDAGPDRLSCNLTPVQLGVNPKPGHVYSWSPVTGLSDPTISNPIATPTTTTTYVVTTSHEGGGCVTTDTVVVRAAVLDSSLQLIGLATFCAGDPQAAVLKVNAADSIQWYRNNIAIPGATQTTYTVTQSGTYHATVFSFVGCQSNTPTQVITIHEVPVAGFNITSPAEQCLRNNQFTFNNTSTITTGTITYNWNMGDGNTYTTANPTHSYTQTGVYNIRLLVTSGNGCVDSMIRQVRLNPSPNAVATVDKDSRCFYNNAFAFTNSSTVEAGAVLSYYWDMADGNSYNTRDIVHSYAVPGLFNVRLLLNTDRGCTDSIFIPVNVNPTPKAGFTVNNAQQCFGGNDFILTNTTTIEWGAVNYNWEFGDGNTGTGLHVNHSYANPGTYRIKMLASSDSSCADSAYRDVEVLPYPFADFFVREPACINQDVLVVNKAINNTSSTLTYLWDFGNSHTETVRSPAYAYPAPGTYNLTLTVSTTQCPGTLHSKIVPIRIEAPAASITYPEVEAIFNYPLRLQARPIGNNVIWSPALNLDNRFSYTPSFRGIHSQLYTIQLTTPSGCVTVDTQFVRTKKKIEIYVPNVFTPDRNGLNDYLRPTLFGFDHVNYFRVYNRWGKLLFQMNSDRPGWDGRINGNITTETQTVVWMIEAVDVDGVTHRKQGTTVLLR